MGSVGLICPTGLIWIHCNGCPFINFWSSLDSTKLSIARNGSTYSFLWISGPFNCLRWTLEKQRLLFICILITLSTFPTYFRVNMVAVFHQSYQLWHLEISRYHCSHSKIFHTNETLHITYLNLWSRRHLISTNNVFHQYCSTLENKTSFEVKQNATVGLVTYSWTAFSCIVPISSLLHLMLE